MKRTLKGIKHSFTKHKELENDMREALKKRQEFILFFQPEIDITTMQIVGWEALLRWKHPEKGILLPEVFIPIAEEAGLIFSLGDLVFEQALYQLHTWLSRVSYPMTMAINVSIKQIEDKRFVKNIIKKLKKWHVSPMMLELELTEKILMEKTSFSKKEIQKLLKVGVHITIDDYGMGLSSLKDLMDFQVYKLKIDKRFLQRAPQSDKGMRIMETIISIGHLLGMKVVMEGVETNQDFKILRKLRCDYSQGYYTGQPMDDASATEFLEKNLAMRELFFQNQLDLPLKF